MTYNSYEATILGYLHSVDRLYRTRPLYLGGTTASGGGVGQPPGGFIGQLTQSNVAFDLSESSSGMSDPMPVSGLSLLHNLNTIRHRITDLEASSGISSISVQGSGVALSSAITVLDFANGLNVSVDGETATVTNTFSGGGSSDHSTLSNLDYASAGHTGFQATLTAEVDYLTPATANWVELTDGSDTVLHDHDGISENTLARHTQDTDTDLGAVSAKNPPIDADKAIYRDSTAADALVTSTWTQIKAFLKTYFDTLYTGVSSGQYRQYTWVASAGGGWEFVSLDNEPVLNLEDLE